MRGLSVALFLLGFSTCAATQEFILASGEEGRRILSTSDEYTSGMGPFERSARLRTDRAATESEYLALAASAVMDWEDGERAVVEAALRSVRAAAAQLQLPLPARVTLIKTSGIEEGQAAYTRGSSIVLPRQMLTGDELKTRRLLAHELFHVASRSHPALAGELYALIGFHPCGDVQLPEILAVRRITNPDAPGHDYCIEVQFEERPTWAVPVLFSRSETYDPAAGGTFFDYLQFALLLVDFAPGGEAARARADAKGPGLVTLEQVSGYMEQVGANTGYVIHPEEIMADNFAILVLGDANVPTPRIPAEIRNVLTNPGSVDPAP